MSHGHPRDSPRTPQQCPMNTTFAPHANPTETQRMPTGAPRQWMDTSRTDESVLLRESHMPFKGAPQTPRGHPTNIPRASYGRPISSLRIAHGRPADTLRTPHRHSMGFKLTSCWQPTDTPRIAHGCPRTAYGHLRKLDGRPADTSRTAHGDHTRTSRTAHGRPTDSPSPHRAPHG